jgi:hypothetical protein
MRTSRNVSATNKFHSSKPRMLFAANHSVALADAWLMTT